MAVSKRLRYEILRRDNHACRYCGAAAPDVKLTVDHVAPITLGGGDDPANLVTACTDCNSGKSATPPGAPVVADVERDAERWARAMLQASALALQQREEAEEERQWFRDMFRDHWQACHGWSIDLDAEQIASLRSLSRAGVTWLEIEHAIDVTSQGYRREPWNYFCGVCWNLLRKRQQIARQLLEAGEN